MTSTMTPPATAINASKIDAFANRMVGALNESALCIMISLGHRAGLFDRLAERPDFTTDELAEHAGLNERYVREWLNALVSAQVVDYNPATSRYSLPAEYAALLTRAAVPNNIAATMQYIPLMGGIEDKILACFREGGGVPYEDFPRFHEVMAEDSAQTVLACLFDTILPLVDGLHERLERGIEAADLGCGRGRALMAMAGRYPNSRFTGYDLSAEAIGWARERAAEQGLTNIRFEVRDLSDYDLTAEPEAFDFVTTFDAVHDQAKPAALLGGIRRSLRPDGVYLMQDIHASSHVHGNIGNPLGTLLYTISTFHCMTVSLAQGGEGLGTCWGREKAEAMLQEAGFTSIDVQRLEHDIQNDFYVVRP